VLVLAGTTEGLHVVDDGGEAERVADGAVGALAVAPDGSWWAIVDHHDLVRVRDGRAEVVDRSGEQLTCVVATASDVVAGTVGAHLLHLVDGTLARIESFEELDGRDGWTQPWGAPGDLRSFASDGAQTVFANVHVGGVLRTQDGGETWVQTIDPHVDVHEVALAPDGRVFAATGAAGLASCTAPTCARSCRRPTVSWSARREGRSPSTARSIAASAGTAPRSSPAPTASRSGSPRTSTPSPSRARTTSSSRRAPTAGRGVLYSGPAWLGAGVVVGGYRRRHRPGRPHG
jgi:hypothetical protein